METTQNSKPLKLDETGMALLRLKELVDLNYVTDFSKVNEPFYISVLTEVLIHSSHLLQYLSDHYTRIDFTDDIPSVITKTGNCDITDVICFFRNAACHDVSTLRESIDWNTTVKSIAFAIVVGTKPYLDYPILGKYEDDAMLLMGTKHLYIKHHLIRAYNELMKSYLSNPDFILFKVFLKKTL